MCWHVTTFEQITVHSAPGPSALTENVAFTPVSSTEPSSDTSVTASEADVHMVNGGG